MSFKHNKRLKLKPTLVSIALLTAMGSVSAAQETTDLEDIIERIQVTGSSIKRTDMEGALPITTISSEDIAKTGVTNVSDLIQAIPAMQGFTVPAQSVGSGNGSQTASLRDLGSSYTLVLLNGRRMAARDSGGSVDISAIPLAAIKRVEILMDGASALYGSDAIAGVVNFIMKDDFQGITISARLDKPQEDGGESNSFDITAGYGDLSIDGFNVMLTYSHGSQEQLKSTQRDFSKTGIVPFTHNGTDLFVQRASSNAIPANLYLRFDELSSQSFNPYREANGACAENNAPTGNTCLYDFTETVEIYPESSSDNFLLNGVVAINDDSEFYGNAMYSRYKLTSRIAPKTVSNYQFDLDSPFVQNVIQPMLTADEFSDLNRVRVKWRTRPAGNRTNEYDTETLNFTAGIRGEIGDISYDVALTQSESTREQSRTAGYMLDKEFGELMDSGTINIFTTPDQLSTAEEDAVKAAAYNGAWDSTKTTANSIEGTLSAPVYELPAGDIYLGGGFDYREVTYANNISAANEQELLYSYSKDEEFDLSRETYGIFLETIIPITDQLEVTAAVRYDNIGGITDKKRASGEQGVNDDVSDTTYKLSAAWRPTDDLLIRASMGTGFKSATMIQIAGPKEDAGFTSGSYVCPLTGSHPLAQYCEGEPTQYRMAREGYDQLKPETSEQRSLGFVYSPSNDFSVSIDWWQINLEEQVRRVTEQQIMADPALYNDLFGTRPNSQSGELELQITRSPVNIGKANNQGIDWVVSLGHEFAIGTVTSTLRGAYMLESESLRVGTVGIYDTSLGKFGSNNAVTFPHIIKWTTSLTHDDFTHSVNMNYRSGYEDQAYTAEHTKIRLQSDLNQRYDQAVERTVASYITVNYLSKWNVSASLTASIGVKNLLDKAPPFSLRTAGGGHQVGYDPRYSDELGRTYYMKASYTF
ncbi:MAG: TonB-dependent receptor [Colwellia sp.]|nr:TonB-dependent receptor [Colwellia sp.]